MVCDPVLAGAPEVSPASIEKIQESVLARPAGITANHVLSHVGYALSDIAFVHPIPNAQYLGDAVGLIAAQNERNVHGDIPRVKTIQTAAGAGGAIHGALSAGVSVTSFVHSHSLAHITPSLYAIARESLPAVFHVAARSIDGSLVVRNDHTDVLALRQTGAVIVSSASAQEAHDIAVAAHIAAAQFRVPVIHFFDGTTVPSADAGIIDVLSTERLAAVISDIERNGISGNSSVDSLFSTLALTAFSGRTYSAFEYHGPADAKTVIVLLAADAGAVTSILSAGKVGVINVRVYRPFHAAGFLAKLPSTVRRIAVVDRTTDATSVHGPLFLDVCATLQAARSQSALHSVRVAPGVTGTAVIGAVAAHLATETPLRHFGVGTGENTDVLAIEDAAVSFVSVNLYEEIDAAALVKQQDEAADNAPEGIDRKILRRHEVYWPLLFPTAYEKQQATRPDLEETTFTVTVTENRRLTPDNYDRNVFHLEFDTADSGLTYEIGDALGVHGHNDPAEVDDFIDYYGVNPDGIVSQPLHGDHTKVSLRTVRQVLLQESDLFGRPTKAFYAELAKYATNAAEKTALELIAGPDGAAEFKRRVEETTTFADVLREFRSARPPIERLFGLVPEIKPRHYSIASSQRMHPNSVHLLVVLVEWETPAGRKRVGQCTRYLASLAGGSNVTVSIKPSVMKLPPLDSQPVIMAGLGTGMAPFRAFIQERAVRRAEGHEVGPMSLYFGSRSRHMEYLYGEELEAYHADGILTNLRLAFSRDGPDKVYIQHKIEEDKATVGDYLLAREGHFYLCGPTWPAADVRDAITGAFEAAGLGATEASDEIERLKEDGRYILEVY